MVAMHADVGGIVGVRGAAEVQRLVAFAEDEQVADPVAEVLGRERGREQEKAGREDQAPHDGSGGGGVHVWRSATIRNPPRRLGGRPVPGRSRTAPK